MAAHEVTDRPGRARFAEMLRSAEDGELDLVAYRISDIPMTLALAPSTRAWIEATAGRFARRCLPLMLANQAGWFVLNSHVVRATWDGGDDEGSIGIEFLSGEAPYPAISHFGHGVLTWHVPFLFRTPPGWNLLARGPANWPKDGAFALEGLVETDWTMATFTMNWKMTAVERPVMFDAGEPICMLVPQRRGELERFRPRVLDVAADPDVERGYEAWGESRERFLAEVVVPDSEAAKRGWEKHYFQGTTSDGTAAPAHQTKLRLGEVDDPDGWCPPTDRLLGT